MSKFTDVMEITGDVCAHVGATVGLFPFVTVANVAGTATATVASVVASPIAAIAEKDARYLLTPFKLVEATAVSPFTSMGISAMAGSAIVQGNDTALEYAGLAVAAPWIGVATMFSSLKKDE